MTPSTTRAYGAGVASSASTPRSPAMCMLILVTTATTPNNTPTDTASSTARCQPSTRTATTTQQTMITPHTLATMAATGTDAKLSGGPGRASSTKTASPIVSTPAQ